MAEQVWQIEEKLEEARAALHTLLMGARAVTFEYDGKRTQYTQASADGLRAYVRELEQKLARLQGGPRRRALRVTY